MDFGQTAKSNPIGGVAVATRTDIAATRGGVSVELPPEQTVQSAPAGDAVKLDLRNDRRGRQQPQAAQSPSTAETGERQIQDVVQRRLVIEPTTRSIVVQEKDARTGETVQTIPDEATLKLRLFARAVADRAREISSATSRYVERTA